MLIISLGIFTICSLWKLLSINYLENFVPIKSVITSQPWRKQIYSHLKPAVVYTDCKSPASYWHKILPTRLITSRIWMAIPNQKKGKNPERCLLKTNPSFYSVSFTPGKQKAICFQSLQNWYAYSIRMQTATNKSG